jgi:ABC-type amino acid transport substrate-binding protein
MRAVAPTLRRLAGLLLAALVLGAGGPAATAAAAPATATLHVLAYETPPFFYRENGQSQGLEYEILQYYAKAKGLTLRVTWVPQYETMLSRLAGGEGDVAAGTLTITPERQQQLDFSAPYFPVRVILIEPKDRTTTSLAALAGATLATIKGTTYEEALSKVPNSHMVYGVTEDDLLRLVVEGKARAAAADSALVLGLMRKYPQLHAGMPLSPEQGLGFAMRKGSPLQAQLSQHIAQLKAGRIYYRLLDKYFGAEAAKLVAAGKS